MLSLGLSSSATWHNQRDAKEQDHYRREKRGRGPPFADERARLEYTKEPRHDGPNAYDDGGGAHDPSGNARPHADRDDGATQAGHSRADQDPPHQAKPDDHDLVRLDNRKDGRGP